MIPTVPLQARADPLAVAGTAGSLAALLSLTAHVAARNVLGDVRLRDAAGVGPLPAAVAMLPAAVGLNSFLAIALAIAADLGAVKYLYGRSWRLSAYVTLIHAVVSVILGTVVVSFALLLRTAPG